MSTPAPALDRFTLHFTDAALERRYRAAEDGHTLRMGRIAAGAGAALALATGILLHVFVPRHLLGTDHVLGGAVAVALFFTFMYATTHAPAVLRHPQEANIAGNLLFALGLMVLLAGAPAEFVQNRGFLVVLNQLFAMYGLLRFRFVPGAVAGVSCVLLYAVVMGVRGWIPQVDLLRHLFWLSMVNVWGMLVCYQLDLSKRREFVAREAVERERARAEGLLLNILPAAIAQRLKASPARIAEHAEPVTVLFADIVGFTPLSASKKPAELVDLLDRVFTGFDEIVSQHGLEKIKTIGDAYMAVAGLPDAQPDHAVRGARAALAMVEHVRQLAQDTGEALQVRIGMHTGPVVAGVIGRNKFSYDLWGDTVNTASRMESAGLPGAVHCTRATADCLRADFSLQSRGLVDIKGKGPMETYVLGNTA